MAKKPYVEPCYRLLLFGSQQEAEAYRKRRPSKTAPTEFIPYAVWVQTEGPPNVRRRR